MSMPKHWEGCEHVVECVACRGKGYTKGMWKSECPICEKRGILWGGVSIPENMILRGYSVSDGVCYHGTVPMTESQICANIWHLDGEVVEVKPAPLQLLDNVKVTEAHS